MDLYIIKSLGFVKVGVSTNFENRKKAYGKNIEKFEIFSSLSDDLAILIESLTVDKFNSQTEYLYGVDFDEVVRFVKSKLNIKIVDFYFNPLELNLKKNDEGYYDLSPCMDYVNNIRNNKGKNPLFIADYTKTKKTKEFLDVITPKYGKKPIVAKAGKYGGSYAVPEVIIDFLMEADSSIKYDVLNWAYKNKVEYFNFMQI